MSKNRQCLYPRDPRKAGPVKKLGEILRCNPLMCLSAFFVIVGLLFGSIKSDIHQIRQEITGIYSVLIAHNDKTALLSPEARPAAPLPR